ncbi:hypothetical protein DV738_g5636, partial [Chaetothyriales sp. CBS 135597]
MLSFLNSSLANPRQTLLQILNFGLILSTAFMSWKMLSVVSDSPSPIVVVVSGSMEPGFQRGDLLFLWNRDPEPKVGEIVVYNVKGKDMPIVHRIMRSYSSSVSSTTTNGHAVDVDATGRGGRKLLTKGDSNAADDTELYADGQRYLDRDENVIGCVKGYLPVVGYVTLMLSEHPWLKQVMIALMGLTALLQRE